MASETARESFELLGQRPAVVTIDLHRGHLDPDVATLPLPADVSAALVRRVVPTLDALRNLDVPVFHVITAYRDQSEILSNPYWRFQAGRPGSARQLIAEHNLVGTPGLELMPGIAQPGDVLIETKKRYDCFIGTDLEFALRSAGRDSILIFGVNTNSCVIATALAASVRDFAVFLVEDGVDTMLSRELHEAALAVIDASFGWVIDSATTLELLSSRVERSATVRGGQG
jgi:nicotinamidase-related amidase